VTLLVLAAHEGEEFAVILPVIMLVGAFFILRWANKKDATEGDEAEEVVAAADTPVGLVLPRTKVRSDDDAELAASLARPDGDETTR
jgi:hypothetical protein